MSLYLHKFQSPDVDLEHTRHCVADYRFSATEGGVRSICGEYYFFTESVTHAHQTTKLTSILSFEIKAAIQDEIDIVSNYSSLSVY